MKESYPPNTCDPISSLFRSILSGKKPIKRPEPFIDRCRVRSVKIEQITHSLYLFSDGIIKLFVKPTGIDGFSSYSDSISSLLKEFAQTSSTRAKWVESLNFGKLDENPKSQQITNQVYYPNSLKSKIIDIFDQEEEKAVSIFTIRALKQLVFEYALDKDYLCTFAPPKETLIPASDADIDFTDKWTLELYKPFFPEPFQQSSITQPAE